jgi:hypothetical protein
LFSKGYFDPFKQKDESDRYNESIQVLFALFGKAGCIIVKQGNKHEDQGCYFQQKIGLEKRIDVQYDQKKEP